MTKAIIEFFRSLLGNDFLTTFIISIVPIIELRGAIPVGIEMGLAWWQAFGLAYLGSSLVVPILLLVLRPILNLMKKVKIFARLANIVEDMFQEKAAKIAKRTGGGESSRKETWIKILGVYTFVALPIPLTGVWTGAAVAVFLGLPFWKSLCTILLGNLTAGIIVTLLSVFFKPYLDMILTVFFILVIVIVVFYIIMLTVKMVRSKKRDKVKSNMTVNDPIIGQCEEPSSVEVIDNVDGGNQPKADIKEDKAKSGNQPKADIKDDKIKSGNQPKADTKDEKAKSGNIDKKIDD